MRRGSGGGSSASVSNYGNQGLGFKPPIEVELFSFSSFLYYTCGFTGVSNILTLLKLEMA